MNNGEAQLTLTIGTDGSGIPVRDVYRFLELLRAAYVQCLWVHEKSEYRDLRDGIAFRQVAERALASGPSLRGYALDGLASSDLPASRDMLLLDIRRENPLELILGGVAVALGAAVIISGGEINIGVTGVKCKVNSLGDGIKKIRKAFSVKTRSP